MKQGKKRQASAIIYPKLRSRLRDRNCQILLALTACCLAAGCNSNVNNNEPKGQKRDTAAVPASQQDDLMSVLDQFVSVPVSGFDTAHIGGNPRNCGPEPFLASDCPDYYREYRGLAATEWNKRMDSSIRAHSKIIRQEYDKALRVLSLGIVESNKIPASSVLFFNDTAAVLYMSSPKGNELKHLKIDHTLIRLMDSIFTDDLYSNDEFVFSYDPISFVSYYSHNNRKNFITIQSVGYESISYEDWRYKNFISEEGFRQRQRYAYLLKELERLRSVKRR